MPYPPVESLLPHGPPMLLVDSIVAETEAGLVCKVVIRDDFVFLRDGEAELVICVELVAQAVGCLSGLRDVRHGRTPRPGLLVGCRDARFSGANLRVGDDLEVTIETKWVREPVASFHGRVERAHEVIAEVEVVVVATDDAAAAMEAIHAG